MGLPFSTLQQSFAQHQGALTSYPSLWDNFVVSKLGAEGSVCFPMRPSGADPNGFFSAFNAVGVPAERPKQMVTCDPAIVPPWPHDNAPRWPEDFVSGYLAPVPTPHVLC